jgi:probable phosphoglycerate mutase
MPGTPVRIVLVRHGETVSNVEGRWQGHSDSPLTERGRAQARELARALADEQIAAVYTSDLGRAYATAQALAEPHGLNPGAEPRLREQHVGEWTGRLAAELRVEEPERMADWRERPWALRIPGAETLAEVQARALAFLDERLPEHAGQTVALVTHGAMAQCLLVRGLGQPLETLWLKQRFDNCQISRLEWTAEEGLRVIELSDVRHLAEVGTLRTWRVGAQPAPSAEGPAGNTGGTV